MRLFLALALGLVMAFVAPAVILHRAGQGESIQREPVQRTAIAPPATLAPTPAPTPAPIPIPAATPAPAATPTPKARRAPRPRAEAPKERRARAEFFAKLGDALREQRDYDEAIASYQRALNLDPKNFAAISGRERSRALRSLDLD